MPSHHHATSPTIKRRASALSSQPAPTASADARGSSLGSATGAHTLPYPPSPVGAALLRLACTRRRVLPSRIWGRLHRTNSAKWVAWRSWKGQGTRLSIRNFSPAGRESFIALISQSHAQRLLQPIDHPRSCARSCLSKCARLHLMDA